MNAKACFEAVEQAASLAQNETRFLSKIESGQIVRQGDIYIHPVEATHKHGDLLKSNQLAEGNTKGSRHVAEGSSVKCYQGTALPSYFKGNTWFMGPMVESPERFTITHPEHAHVSLPAGCYQISHQMDAASQQRVQD